MQSTLLKQRKTTYGPAVCKLLFAASPAPAQSKRAAFHTKGLQVFVRLMHMRRLEKQGGTDPKRSKLIVNSSLISPI
jgi:hypothetical protein